MRATIGAPGSRPFGNASVSIQWRTVGAEPQAARRRRSEAAAARDS
jgi:hypothetical protein